MAWEWSHTEEAYGYAEEQLHGLERRELLQIAEHWTTKLTDAAEESHERSTWLEDEPSSFEPPVWPDFADMSNSCLADWVWEQASSWEHGRTCSNGGHELYLDPDGYHTVDLRDMPEDWTPSEY